MVVNWASQQVLNKNSTSNWNKIRIFSHFRKYWISFNFIQTVFLGSIKGHHKRSYFSLQIDTLKIPRKIWKKYGHYRKFLRKTVWILPYFFHVFDEKSKNLSKVWYILIFSPQILHTHWNYTKFHENGFQGWKINKKIKIFYEKSQNFIFWKKCGTSLLLLINR